MLEPVPTYAEASLREAVEVLLAVRFEKAKGPSRPVLFVPLDHVHREPLNWRQFLLNLLPHFLPGVLRWEARKVHLEVPLHPLYVARCVSARGLLKIGGVV